MKILCLAQHKHDTQFFLSLKQQSSHTITIQTKKHLSILFVPRINEVTQAFSDNLSVNHFLLKRHPQPLAKKLLIRFYSPILYSQAKDFLQKGSYSAIAMWNGNNWVSKAYTKAAQEIGIKTFFFELGPLSKTFCCDAIGVNADNSLPRNASFYLGLKKTSFTPSTLVPRKSKSTTKEVLITGNYIFAPFQVDSDSQIKLNSPWVKDMSDFFDALNKVSKYLPNQWKIVVKEHPSCKKNHHSLHHINPNIIFANGNNTQKLIEDSSAIITINSSVGIEALTFKKKVISIGKAFYNIEGLTLTASNLEGLIEHIKNVQDDLDNEAIRSRFLSYLKNSYLIHGELGKKEQIDWETIDLKLKGL